jgi:putative flippase GtrA
MRFGVVGVCASAVHFGIVISLVEMMAYPPLVANVLAFLLSFQVSYWGHRSWTFSGTTALHRVALPKLFLIGSVGLLANEGLFFLFLSVLHLPYQLALFFVLTILPIINFTLGKLWVFR